MVGDVERFEALQWWERMRGQNAKSNGVCETCLEEVRTAEEGEGGGKVRSGREGGRRRKES